MYFLFTVLHYSNRNNLHLAGTEQ